MSDALILYGPDGKQLKPKEKSGSGRYSEALRLIHMDADSRIREPYSAHSFVYAAATAIALNISQVRISAVQEVQERTSRAGVGRSFSRHLNDARRSKGAKIKAVEPLPAHPFNTLLYSPNPTMNGPNDLIYHVALMLAVRGEAPLLPLRTDGTPWLPGDRMEDVEEIVPLNPDILKEKVDNNGVLRYWSYRPNRSDYGHELGSKELRLMPLEVIMPKFYNPLFPLRGMSPIAASAEGIRQDVQAKKYNSTLLVNGGEPNGVLLTDQVFDEQERDEALKSWQERYGGSNRRKTALLEGGFRYVPLSMSPKDMEFLEQQKWNREEVLASMGVPKSVLSVTDNLNYSIQLSQDRNFWNKRLLPIIRLIETVFDRTLFFGELDNVGPMFDLSEIEALQEDVSNKVDIAIRLIREGRVSPRTAYDLVGLEIPEQEHDSLVLIPTGLQTMEQLLTEPEQPTEEPKSRRKELKWGPSFYKLRGHTRSSWAEKQLDLKATSQKKYERMMSALEPSVIRPWRQHNRGLMKEVLDNMDRIGVSRRRAFEEFLFDSSQAANSLRVLFSSPFDVASEKAAGFTESELEGLFVFDIQDDVMQDYLEQRKRVTDRLNKTTRNRLLKQMEIGFQNGENLDQLKDRVRSTFKKRMSDRTATSIARTELAGIFGGTRDIIFDQEGVKNHLWSTSGDELVRPDHVSFGAKGVVPRGFNFMKVIRKSGTLNFPGQPGGPTDQIVNCRCVALAM